MPTTTVSLTHLANNTLPKTLVIHVDQLTFAEIAHGHPHPSEKKDSMHAGLFPTPTSMLQTTTM